MSGILARTRYINFNFNLNNLYTHKHRKITTVVFTVKGKDQQKPRAPNNKTRSILKRGIGDACYRRPLVPEIMQVTIQNVTDMKSSQRTMYKYIKQQKWINTNCHIEHTCRHVKHCRIYIWDWCTNTSNKK